MGYHVSVLDVSPHDGCCGRHGPAVAFVLNSLCGISCRRDRMGLQGILYDTLDRPMHGLHKILGNVTMIFYNPTASHAPCAGGGVQLSLSQP